MASNKETNATATALAKEDTQLPNVLSDTAIKRLLAHPTNAILDRQLGYTVDFFIQYVLTSADYDIVSLGTGSQQLRLTADYLHYLLYSYIINRASAIAITEADNYVIRDALQAKTDDAFVYLADALMKREVVQTEEIDGQTKRVLTHEGERMPRALKVITQTPIKLRVQERTGLVLRQVEYAMFWFTPARCGKGWDTEWEYVSSSHASCFHRDEVYDF